jgi:hypothetical protein
MESDSDIIQRLAEELDIWRSENSSTRPLPVNIWSEASKVAQRAGVRPVSKALRLDHSKLRRLTLKELGRCPVSAATFVELLPLVNHSLGDCALEIDSPRGNRLRIQISNATSSGLASLIRELMVA